VPTRRRRIKPPGSSFLRRAAVAIGTDAAFGYGTVESQKRALGLVSAPVAVVPAVAIAVVVVLVA
jgi:hypothetical protein